MNIYLLYSHCHKVAASPDLNSLHAWLPLHGHHGGMRLYSLTMYACRVQSEVEEVLGTKDHVSAEDLEKLEYTEQVK